MTDRQTDRHTEANRQTGRVNKKIKRVKRMDKESYNNRRLKSKIIPTIFIYPNISDLK